MASAGYTIHVSGLSPETSEEKLDSFFSFCGKTKGIKKIDASTAEITFEKESAAKTALMLNGGTLDGAHLEVTSSLPSTPVISSTPATTSGVGVSLPTGATSSTPIGAGLGVEEGHVSQEDKPKAGIVAEYLAHGYVLGDHIISRAIDIDRKQGISSKFLNYITNLDAKLGQKIAGDESTKASHVAAAPFVQATETIKAYDHDHGVSARFNDYYSKALNTKTGQTVLKFYTDTSKQVQDVHNEAVRIAAEKKSVQGGPGAAHDVAPTVTEKVDSAAASVPVSQ